MQAAAGSAFPGNFGQPAMESGGANGFFLILTYFRENNADALRIRERLQKAITCATAESPKNCLADFAEARDVIGSELQEASRRADAIEKLRSLDPGTEAWYARELAEVRNAWDDLERIWTVAPPEQDPLPELVRRGKNSVEILDELAYISACQTIPDELKNYLQNYRIGTCLDFVKTFGDQLPDEAYTRKVLETLAPQSELVPGLIDVKNAKVIKADRRTWRQVLSTLYVLVAAALGFGLIALAVHLGTWLQFDPAQWPLNRSTWAVLNGGYVLVLAGVLMHWILDRVKLNRAGADATPFSEWLMWIHVNEVSIVVRIATVWLLMGMGIAFKLFDLSKAVAPVTFFTAGYFMDSTFDALVGRFNTFIGGMDPGRKKDADKH